MVTYLYVFTVAAPSRQCNAAVRDRALQQDLDGRLFDAVFAVQHVCSTICEVSLYCNETT